MLQPARAKEAPVSFFGSLGLVVSPYYPSGWGSNRTTMKAIVGLDYQINGLGQGYVGVAFINGNTFATAVNIAFDILDATDSLSLVAAAESAITTYATAQGYTLTSLFWTYPSGATALTFNNSPARSITTGTGATGFQISVTRNAFVSASMGIVTTASIGSGQDAYIVMELCATNSATAGDWTEVARIRNGQTYTLAIAILGVQTIMGDMARMVPAGWYAKYRSVNVTGTPTLSWISGQEVLM